MSGDGLRHSVTVTDAEAKQGVCSVCGPVRLRRRVINGRVSWRCRVKHCMYSRGRNWGKSASKIIREVALGLSCERCGFLPEVPQQLEVHHRDSDRTNNDPANLRTLCANCHRLAHYAPEIF